MGTTLASQIWLVIYRSKSSLQLSRYSVIRDYWGGLLLSRENSEVVLSILHYEHAWLHYVTYDYERDYYLPSNAVMPAECIPTQLTPRCGYVDGTYIHMTYPSYSSFPVGIVYPCDPSLDVVMP
ncbi:hypothetical protein HAX54_043317, partial [Datura stramonium]|nr:hypothetical protein [Datura stramonium]